MPLSIEITKKRAREVRGSVNQFIFNMVGTDNGKVVFDEDYAVTGIPGQTLGDVETMIKRRMQGTIDDYKRSQRLAGFSEADLTAKIADIKSGLVL